MPLVETRYQTSSQHRDVGPAKGPARTSWRWQRFSPRPKQQNAQEAISEHVPSLPHVKMPILKSRVAHTKQEVHQGVQEATGVVSGKVRSRLDGDNDQPKYGSDPRF